MVVGGASARGVRACAKAVELSARDGVGAEATRPAVGVGAFPSGLGASRGDAREAWVVSASTAVRVPAFRSAKGPKR